MLFVSFLLIFVITPFLMNIAIKMEDDFYASFTSGFAIFFAMIGTFLFVSYSGLLVKPDGSASIPVLLLSILIPAVLPIELVSYFRKKK